MAKLIVIEGPDKVGKETQTKMLVEYLQSCGKRVIRVEVPVHDKLTHRLIYWMLKNGLAKKTPTLFQGIQYFNKKIFQMFKLPRLNEYYDYVIMDRWSLSSIVYGIAGGANSSLLVKLASFLKKPDATIILHGKPHIDRKDDLFESDDELQTKVRDMYWDLSLGREEYTLIPAGGTREEVHSGIVWALRVKNLL